MTARASALPVLLALVTALLCTVPPLQAQSASGTLSGTITRQGQPVPTADVELKNGTSGDAFTTRTDASGRYSVAVPAGTYTVVVPGLGFSANRFEQHGQVVGAGKTTTLDISLVVSNDGVIGDDAAYLAIRSRSANVRGPLPRTARGTPDLSGMWNANVDPHPQAPPLQPWAQAKFDQFIATEFKDLPSAACLPDDPAWTVPLLYQIIQTPTLLVFLTETEPHYRMIFMDGRDHPADLDPTWMGHSIGRWDGDTLVVDTVGLNDRTTVTNTSLPHSDQLHIVERFTRADLARMKHEVTLTDPGAFTKPLVWNSEWQLAPGEELLESICTENNKYQENIAPR